MPEYKRLDEKAWADFGKNLLEEKGSEKQKDFLRSCRSVKDGFLEYLTKNLLCREKVFIEGEFIPLDRLDRQFTEDEFCCPPKDTQNYIWETFGHVPDEITSYCGFWGYVIMSMIKTGCIKPDYLASESNGATKTGSYMIDEALKSDEKAIDKRVRRILRSMCNHAPRGKRIVFNDFYLGKAYWCCRWSEKMSQYMDGLSFEAIHTILDMNYYAAFAAKMHSGKSYIGSKNILGGLLLYLKKAKKISGDELKKIIDKIAYLSAWKALEIQEPALNKGEIEKISESVIT